MDHAVVIGLTVPAVAGCFSAIFFGFWYHKRDDRSALRFAVAFLCYGLGFTTNHFVFDKDTLANAIVHNCFYAVGLFLLLDGIHRAFQRRTPALIMASIAACSVLGAIIVQLSPVELSQRILWINTLQASMLLVSARTLWGIWKLNWTGTATYAALLLCMANALGVAPYTILRSFITEETFFETIYWGTMNFVSMLSMLAMAGALIANRVMQRVQSLRADADHDYLTGLKTRRAFEDVANAYCNTRSGDVAASLMIIDIDHFKSINDEYGHTTGDEVLSRLGRFLSRQTRSSDIAGRMGGEEFYLLLPGTDTRGARQLAARLRTKLTSLTFEGLPDDHAVTASFGIAELGARTAFADLYAMADAALYAAKAGGRDRIVCAPLPGKPGRPIRRDVFQVRPDGSRQPERQAS